MLKVWGPSFAEDRMKWLVLLAAVVLVAPWCRAETGGERVFRLAQIAASRSALDYTHEVTVPELAKLGFVEGKNLVMLDRFGEHAELPRLVQDVLQAKVDAIITFGGDILLAASLGTKTVPIVSSGP